MTALAPLPEQDEHVTIVPMLTPTRAVDLYLSDCISRGLSDRTVRTYTWHLDKFADLLPDHYDVTDIRPDDCRRHLARWDRKAQGSKAHAYTVLNAFLEWLRLQERVKRNPLDQVPTPRRIPAEDLDVVTVSADGVQRLLAAGQTWTERLAVAIPAYMGPRRRAVARLRLRDYDQLRGRIRFREKGGKTIWKPVPDELAAMLDAAIIAGAINGPDDYLIPPEGKLVKPGDRDDRVIWRVVNRVAARAGVETHVHALRAAFATFYLEQNPGDLEGLRALLGHRSISTTQVYLRKLDRQAAMERVRGLSWERPGEQGFGAPIALASGSRTEEVFDVTEYVYFITDGRAIKIGFSGDPLHRLSDLQTHHPEELHLLLAVPGTLKKEAELHRRFADDRIRGEWFTASAELLAYIDSAGNADGAFGYQTGDFQLASSLVVGAGGFEPPWAVTPHGVRAVTQPDAAR